MLNYLSRTLLQAPKEVQHDSAVGRQENGKGEVEHITAGYLHVDVPHSPGISHTEFSSVEPLDHTPPVTDEQSQRQTMQAGSSQQHSLYAPDLQP